MNQTKLTADEEPTNLQAAKLSAEALLRQQEIAPDIKDESEILWEVNVKSRYGRIKTLKLADTEQQANNHANTLKRLIDLRNHLQAISDGHKKPEWKALELEMEKYHLDLTDDSVYVEKLE